MFIDDASAALMHWRFVRSEPTESYFAALAGYLYQHGTPVVFNSHKHSVVRVNNPEARGGYGMTRITVSSIDTFTSTNSFLLQSSRWT